MLGLLLRWRSRVGLYVVCYLAILLTWPYQQEAGRFLLPLLPIALLALYVALLRLTRGVRNGAVAALLLLMMSAVITVPPTSFIYHRHQWAVEQAPELAHLTHLYEEPELRQAVGSVTVMGSAVFARYYLELMGALDLDGICPGKVLALEPQTLTWLGGATAENLPMLTGRSVDDFLADVREADADCVLVTRLATLSVLPGLGLVQVLSPIATPVQAGRLPGSDTLTYVVLRLEPQ